MQKVWTKAEALPVFREAFSRNRLAAQNGANYCAYRSKYGPCVIGLLIDDETAARWDASSNEGCSASLFYGSCENEMRAMFSEKDHKWFRDVQRAHDEACEGFPNSRDHGLNKLKKLLAA